MKILATIVVLLLAFPTWAQQKMRVNVYAYHLFPPLIIDLTNQEGLYFDLVSEFNRRSDKYIFELVYVPRPRINKMLANDELDGVLLGANPKWFNDNEQTKFLWTSPVLEDTDNIVSSANTPFDYQGPDSLKGKSVGGIQGFYYFGIDELVKLGQIARYDARREVELLTLLQKGRVDTAIVSRVTFNYLAKKHGWESEFHIAQRPHDKFFRQILIPKYNQAYFEHINGLTEGLLENMDWYQH